MRPCTAASGKRTCAKRAGRGDVSVHVTRLAPGRRDCQTPPANVSTGMASNPSATPVLFDRDLLRRRQERAQKLGPVTFLSDRVAEDFGDRLQAVMRNFSDVADIWTPGGLP